jgi:uncharacterized membrane protein YphA (DoxX/SURF4 family)
MESLLRVRRWLDAHREIWFEMLRIYLGLALFAKGVSFIRQGTVLFDPVRESMTFNDGVIAHYVVLAHLCGGLLLAFGLVTRLAAAVQIPVLLGAVVFVHAREGLFTPHMTLEFTLLVLALLCLFTAAGAGRLSADAWLARARPVRTRTAVSAP